MMVTIATHTQASLQALLIYLATYAVMNVGAFGVVLAIERRDGQGTTLDDFAGLSRRNPVLAALMAVFMLALAGIPATAGFIGKWYVFYAAVQGAHVELAIIGVLASLLGMYYYLRVIWAMYFVEPATAPLLVRAEEPAPAHEPVVTAATGGVAIAEPATTTGVATTQKVLSAEPAPIHPAAWIGLVLAGILTIVLGIVPMQLVNWALQAAQTLIK
jgi:NADH-quinone oxidoreductase subunit N